VSDESVSAALRSDARLVVVEAPAGCGKTHQGADYAREIAERAGADRLLILTHTHAACSVFAGRTKASAARIEIATIDSMVAGIATAYHAGLGLPLDIASWVRQREDGYGELAARVAKLLARHPMIAASAARRYPTIICDEHQDSSGDQHALVMALADQGARIRVFGDPMQRIFKAKTVVGGNPQYSWSDLKLQAKAEDLDTPHRWKDGCTELGKWTLRARELLKNNGCIDLRQGQLPPSVSVVYADNQAQANLDYRLSTDDRKKVEAFEKAQTSLLVLTRHNEVARAIRAMFFRRLPIWEGHTRQGLEQLVQAMQAGHGDATTIARALVAFMGTVGKGFSPTAFGNRFVQEAQEGCTKATSGKPASLQALARLLLAEADHRGAGKVLRRLAELREQDSSFRDIEIDHFKEFWDAVRIGGFETPDGGLAEITHRRTHARPSPPPRAISTIHKAKGLECGSVILMPCDARTFPDKPDARCLLYVALSRATHRLQLVLSRSDPSPLFIV
jgi:DNA helicase-2/ATP-dependent DNA helicase PcrA